MESSDILTPPGLLTWVCTRCSIAGRNRAELLLQTERSCGSNGRWVTSQTRSIKHILIVCAIGHVRYSTAGEVSILEAQPFLVTCQHGQIAVCHNGNLPFAKEERLRLEREGAIFSSTSDTEVVLHGVARSSRPVRRVAWL